MTAKKTKIKKYFKFNIMYNYILKEQRLFCLYYQNDGYHLNLNIVEFARFFANSVTKTILHILKLMLMKTLKYHVYRFNFITLFFS